MHDGLLEPAEQAFVQGWIARSGVQYGAHLVLYRKHPEQAHSDMCVIIMRVEDGEMRCWRDLEVANRLCGQVCISQLAASCLWH